ncbi:hypothetical protein Tco_1407673 [Tanacetum coccineum]
MSIHDFLCMPSLEKAIVLEEPHELGTSILSRVADHTTPPALAGTAIPRASPEEIAVTQPNRNVVAKADHAAKQKTSTGPEISTNTTKRTRLSQKVSGAGSSGLTAGDEVEQTDDDVTYPPILLPDKKVEAYVELSGGVRRTTRASSHASHGVGEDASSPAQEAVPAPGTQPLDTDAGADEIASDGNVDSYFDARVSNTTRDVLERDLLSFVPRPYYIPYPNDENNGCESPPYTKDDWDEIHGVNLGLRRKELYKDPKCQLITHGRSFHARYDHSLREVERLTKQCAQQTLIIKKQNADLKQHKESTVHARVRGTLLPRRRQKLRKSLSHSWSIVRGKLRRSRAALPPSFSQISLHLSEVKRGLRMGRTDEEFRGLSQRVAGFIPDAKEKFDRVIIAFPNTTFPFLDKISSATASLRTNTHARHSTSSSKTFGHTSTPEHLNKKKKPVDRGGPSTT